MPVFEKAAPEVIIVGGGRNAGDPNRLIIETAPYIEALKASDAGIINVSEDEDPKKVHASLRRAASATRIEIRSKWMSERRLGWKRVGASARKAA